MVFALYGILACSLCYIIYIHITEYLNRKRYRHIATVPVPLTLKWYLGHMPLIWKRTNNFSISFAKVVSDLQDELDEENIVLFFPGFGFISITSIPIISKVFSDHKTFLKMSAKQIQLHSVCGVRVFGPRGIVTEPGTEIWYYKRKIMDPAFQKKYLKCLIGDMSVIAKKMCKLLRQAKRDTIDIYDIMNKVALEVVCNCGFSLNMDAVKDEPSRLNDAAQTVLHILPKCLRTSGNYKFMLPWNFRDDKKRLRKSLEYLRGSMKIILEERMERNEKFPEKIANDILDHIIEGNKFTDNNSIDDILDDFFVFLIAGMETTAITMSMVIWELMKQPAVHLGVVKEVNEVFGNKTELEYDDLNKLVYLEQCIKECLRLHPPTLSSGRISPKTDVTVGGLHIPSGTIIHLPTDTIHHMEKHWPNPYQFDPDRFAPGKETVPFTYFPFTAGPRQCIGKHFAYMEAKIVLAELYKNFQILDPYPNEREKKKVVALTSKPKDGVLIRVEEL